MSTRGAEQVKELAWRNVGVKRERTHEPIVSRFTAIDGGVPVFQYIKDLMVFAATVGHSMGQRKPVEGDTISIILDTYASDQKDGFVYILALLEAKDANVLRPENLSQAVVVFEEYCNAGLYEIQRWLDENPSDPDGIETLLDRTYTSLMKSPESENSDEDITII